MNILGIEFAPLFIPMSRRLQALAVFTQVVTYTFGPLLLVILGLYLLFTSYWYVPVLYLTWCVYDRNTCETGGRRIDAWRSFPLFRYLRDYYPVTLVKTGELDPTKTYIFGAHPHGAMAVGMFCTFATNFLNFEQVFPGINAHMTVLGGWFRLPLVRDVLSFTGTGSVSRQSIDYILSKGPGSAVAIPVGGAAEILESVPNAVRLVLKNRKGFVKRAIVNGASLVPVFHFGENDLYSMVYSSPGSLLRKLQNALKKVIGFYPPVFYGRGMLQYTFGILPYRKPITVVVGKPISVNKDKDPAQEEVDRLHTQYLEELEQLFDKYKEAYGLKDVKIEYV